MPVDNPSVVPPHHSALRLFLWTGVLLIAGVLVWQALMFSGTADPLAPNTSFTSAALDIGVLVFREGLECILVLAAITASRGGADQAFQRPIAAGAGLAFVATLITWEIVVGLIDNLTESFPALQVQAVTGLLAIVVLVVVMNWFFHKIYWTGWISLHTKRKQDLVKRAAEPRATTGATVEISKARLAWGLGVLGFTSLYREGFEVVLFLQNYRLKLGGRPILYGVVAGLFFTAIVAALTFVAHRRLPYRKMLVLTGALLGIVLLVMVGEQAQEMQLAHWLPTTPIAWLATALPPWTGLWLAIFPTVETLSAQAIAASLVLGSYVVVRMQLVQRVRHRSH